MTQLFQGCYATEPKVTPSNWKEKGADLSKEWTIYYRFYDPSVRDEKGRVKPKMVQARGTINQQTTLSGRRRAVHEALTELQVILKHDGWNPITRQYMGFKEAQLPAEVDPLTPLLEAIQRAAKALVCSRRTREEITSDLNYLEPALKKARLSGMPVGEVRRRHIKMLLNQLAIMKPQMDVRSQKGKFMRKGIWTNNTFNRYRKNLSILFEELIEMEATEVNPVLGIKKKKHAVAKRQILSEEECLRVDAATRAFDEQLWRFIHIFFHSGARESEILRVQGQHVNLKKQVVKYLVLKGKGYEWVERPIKNIVLPLWKKAMEGCGTDDYLFSKALKPGAGPIRPEQVTRRWKRHIKAKLDITADLYSLKHLNTTSTIDYLEQYSHAEQATELAAGQTAHKGGAMIVNFYDVKSRERRQEAIRGVDNPLVPQTKAK